MEKEKHNNKIAKQLNREINDLEFKLKHPILTNIGNTSIRNLKIGSKLLQAAAPCILTVSLCGYTFCSLGFTPFIRDEIKDYARFKTEVDNTGKTVIEKQYYEYDDDSNAVFLYSNWELDKHGAFNRYVKIYHVNVKKLDRLIEYLEMDSATIEEALGEPYRTYIETKGSLTEEEMTENPYIKVMFYDRDRNDVTIRRETVGENVAATILFIFMSLYGSFFTQNFVNKRLPVDYKEIIQGIKEKYKNVSSEDIQKKLEIKRENYERLMRN